MKTKILLLLCFFYVKVNAQDTTYFDINWKPIAKEKALYYRTVAPENNYFRITDYYMSNHIQFSCLSHTSKDPLVQEGLATWYFENGSKSGTKNFKNGNVEGESISYYSNGQIRDKSLFINNKREGKYIGYMPSGNVLGTIEYHNDQKNGLMTLKSLETETDYECYFSNNSLNGSYKAFNKEKVLLKKGSFLNDYQNGDCFEYFNNGKLKKKFSFLNQLLNGEYLEYDSLGNKVAFGMFKNGKPLVFENTITLEQIFKFSFKMKMENGIEKWRIFRNNILVFESFYKDNLKFGLWKMYSVDGKDLFETFDYTNSKSIENNYLQKASNSLFDNYELSGRFWDYENLADDLYNKGAKIKKIYLQNKKLSEYSHPFHTYVVKDMAVEEPINFIKNNNFIQFQPTTFSSINYCDKETDEFKMKIFISDKNDELMKLDSLQKPINNEINIYYLFDESKNCKDLSLTFSESIKEALKFKMIQPNYIYKQLQKQLEIKDSTTDEILVNKINVFLENQ